MYVCMYADNECQDSGSKGMHMGRIDQAETGEVIEKVLVRVVRDVVVVVIDSTSGRLGLIPKPSY